MRILLVDDNEVLMEVLAQSLIHQRYAVDIANCGQMAQELIELFDYDLILLDVRLPDTEGTVLCRQLRQRGIDSRIMMLTAMDSSADKVQALDAGADDYMVKPFDFDELCARIRALLRRDQGGSGAVLGWGELSLDTSTFEVAYGQQPVHTTPKEYALLEMFLHAPQRVFSIDTIIDNLWSFEDPPSGDAVRTHIKGLRQKLKAGGAPRDLIETVYGVGYRLKPEVAEASPPETSGEQADVTAAVAQAWERHQGTLHQRLQVLESAANALAAGELHPELHREGRSEAHKLVGSLGCFGLPEGSQLARQLEQMLDPERALDAEQHHEFSQLLQRLRQEMSIPPEQLRPQAMPLVMVLSTDEGLGNQLQVAAYQRQLACVVLAPAQMATQAVAAPDAVVLSVDDPSAEAVLDYLTPLHPQVVLMLTDSQDFHRRLQLVQRGADRLLPSATPPTQVMEVVHQLLGAVRDIRVMLVDDDPQLLDLLQVTLTASGFQVQTATTADQLWRMLETASPDVLVLDVEMPQVDGVELCQLLRADERWQRLPILFLSVHDDLPTQHRVFQAGADDFICKPVVGAELAKRIFQRLRRSQSAGAAFDANQTPDLN